MPHRTPCLDVSLAAFRHRQECLTVQHTLHMHLELIIGRANPGRIDVNITSINIDSATNIFTHGSPFPFPVTVSRSCNKSHFNIYKKIASHPLHPQADKDLLSKELPTLRAECLRVMEVSTTLLKMCAMAGLTLYDVAGIMERQRVDGTDEASGLELACAAAKLDLEVCALLSTRKPAILLYVQDVSLDSLWTDRPASFITAGTSRPALTALFTHHCLLTTQELSRS